MSVIQYIFVGLFSVEHSGEQRERVSESERERENVGYIHKIYRP